MKTPDEVQPARNWRGAKPITAIFLAALALRVAAAFRTAAIFNDGPRFLDIAKAMHAGDWLSALSDAYHPLYPFLVSIAHSALEFVSVESWEMAAVACSALAGAACVVPLYSFIRQAFDERAAAFGAIALAVHPYAVRFSADVQSDAVYLAFFLTAVALLFSALRSRRPALAFATGVATGLAYLTRPEGLGVAVVAVGWCGIALLRGRWRLRAAAAWLSALAAGLVGLAGPYLLAIHAVSGSWIISQKKSIPELLGLSDGDGEGPGWASAAAALGGPVGWIALAGALVIGMSLVGRNMHIVERLKSRNLLRFWRPALAGLTILLWVAVAVQFPHEALRFWSALVSALRPELWLLVAIGIGVSATKRPTDRALFIASFQLLYAAILFGLLLHFGYVSRRHVLPPLVLLLGYAGLGAAALAERCCDAANRTSRRLREAVGRSGLGSKSVWRALITASIAAIALPKALDDYRAEELAGRRAAEWLREQSLPEGRVAAFRSKLGYYADREWVPLAWTNKLRPLATFSRQNVRYVIAEEADPEKELNPLNALRDLHDERLKEVFEVEVRGRHAIVFELRDPSNAAQNES